MVAALVAVVVIWVAVRRRDRRRRAELEREHDAMVRAQVLERLAHVTAQWDGHPDEHESDESPAPGAGPPATAAPDPATVAPPDPATVAPPDPATVAPPDPGAVAGPAPADDDHPHHRGPGHGIRVRRHRRA